tara:strand:- start:10542 stop:11849 length:1308 start_codon:yes stop_codon:yes gene_type:complete
MNFDLNIDNYTKDDYMDIFNLDKSMNPTRNTVEKNYKDLLNNIEEENLDQEEKQHIKVFLSECKNNLLSLLKEDNQPYKLIESDFITDMDQSETFQNNANFVIKKQKAMKNNYHTNKINPIAKVVKTQLININTKFRKNYYNTTATDFILDIPEEFKNVISFTIQSVQIPNSDYTYSSNLGTNEFTIEIFDLDTGTGDASNQQKKTIKILNGIYNGNMLEDYLNTYVFSDEPLNRVGCSYDEITRKFRFFRDYRDENKGGKPAGTNNTRYAFNIDFRLSNDESRPIQLNMGWILGYRQQYYRWQDDYVDSSGVNFKTQEGFNPEAIYDTLGSKYYILSIDDYNKNYSNTLTSPFQESMFNDQNAIAKIPNSPNLQQLDDIFYQSRREYFGPVNIRKMHIKLLDELGRIVDLNNNDFSFSIVIEQLYDPHANKILN